MTVSDTLHSFMIEEDCGSQVKVSRRARNDVDRKGVGALYECTIGDAVAVQDILH